MGVRFSADEILAVAEKIEQNGIRFYEAAARRVRAPKARQLLTELAAREKVHEQTFAAMRARLSDRERSADTFDPDQQSAAYLQALAGGAVFKQDAGSAVPFAQGAAYKDILAAAIEMEKDSIVFYVGLREFAPARLGRTQVDAILKEEMSHLALLNQERTRLGK
jgi:rubrerythrin